MAPVEAISIASAGHNLPLSGQAAMAIAFFGLDTAPRRPARRRRPPGRRRATRRPAPPTSNRPTSHAPTSAPPTTSRPPTTGACGAAGAVQTQWSGGYVMQPVNVTARLVRDQQLDRHVRVAVRAHAGDAWNATVTVSGTTATARGVAYNSSLGAGQSTTFGFQVEPARRQHRGGLRIRLHQPVQRLLRLLCEDRSTRR